MSEFNETNQDQVAGRREEGFGSDTRVDCESIQDPVRRTLCKACGLPVVGEIPFCKDHEPPVP